MFQDYSSEVCILVCNFSSAREAHLDRTRLFSGFAGIIGAALCGAGIELGSFAILCVGSFMFGCWQVIFEYVRATFAINVAGFVFQGVRAIHSVRSSGERQCAVQKQGAGMHRFLSFTRHFL